MSRLTLRTEGAWWVWVRHMREGLLWVVPPAGREGTREGTEAERPRETPGAAAPPSLTFTDRQAGDTEGCVQGRPDFMG